MILTLQKVLLAKFRHSRVFIFFLSYLGGGWGWGHTPRSTLPNSREEWGFRRRLVEYLTQNRGRRAASGPRRPVLGHTITCNERAAGSLSIPPNLKSPTSRSIKSRGRKVSSRRRKKGHNLDEWNWAKGTRSRIFAEVRKKEVKDFLTWDRLWAPVVQKTAQTLCVERFIERGRLRGGRRALVWRRSGRRRRRRRGRRRGSFATAGAGPGARACSPADLPGSPAAAPPPARPAGRPRARHTLPRPRSRAGTPPPPARTRPRRAGRPTRAPSARTPAARPRPRPSPPGRAGRAGGDGLAARGEGRPRGKAGSGGKVTYPLHGFQDQSQLVAGHARSHRARLRTEPAPGTQEGREPRGPDGLLGRKAPGRRKHAPAEWARALRLWQLRRRPATPPSARPASRAPRPASSLRRPCRAPSTVRFPQARHPRRDLWPRCRCAGAAPRARSGGASAGRTPPPTLPPPFQLPTVLEPAGTFHASVSSWAAGERAPSCARALNSAVLSVRAPLARDLSARGTF